MKKQNYFNKFSNSVFVFGGLISAIFAAYSIYRIVIPYDETANPIYYYIFVALGGTTTALFGFGLRLRSDHKIILSVLFLLGLVTIYSLEFYLEFRPRSRPQDLAEQLGIPYDTRTKLEALNDYKKSDTKVFPNFYPRNLIKKNGLDTGSGTIFPMGGISNTITIGNNEAGYYPLMSTDEHGFNNPMGLYRKDAVDIMLIGDSFTEGYSVQSNETISAVLRRYGVNVISVGKGGNGPLIELATLKEFVEPLRPKIVLWLYTRSDIPELHEELTSPLLVRYLNDDNFSQSLILRQKEVDRVLRKDLLERWERDTERERTTIDPSKLQNGRIDMLGDWTARRLKLNRIRMMFNVLRAPGSRQHFPTFRSILERSKKMVSRWGGNLYLVHLTIGKHSLRAHESVFKDFVLRTAVDLNIPTVDIASKVLDNHPDPLSLLPFRMGPHYNAKGFRLIAEAIGKTLIADGLIRPNQLK